MVQVAVAQFAAGDDKKDNIERISALVAEAAGNGAEVVVLPEYAMFTVPVMDERFLDSAEELDGPFVTALRDLARVEGVTVVAGMNEALPGGRRISNTLLALDRHGAIAASYRKLHLYDAFGYRESDVVRPGPIEPPRTFGAGDLVLGLQTCYDLRFPEVTRRLVDAGASVVLVPAAWVPGPLKEDHWVTLLRARAIENTVYVAAADQNAPSGAGHSMVVDPMGVVVASVGERTGVATAPLSAERLAEVRARNPSLSLRRFAVVPASDA